MLRNCLNSLMPDNQQFPEIAYEIIVTDDKLDGNAKTMVETEFPGVHWIQGPSAGPAANRNNGARSAKSEWLIFIDDDCVPDGNLLQNYSKAIKSFPDERAFEGAILPDDWALLKKDLSACPVNNYGNCFWSANVMIHSDLFNFIGGFNVSYKLAAQEDQQIKIDIEKFAGKEIRFLPECVVIHPVRFLTLTDEIKKINSSAKNFAVYASRNRVLLGYTSVFAFLSNQIKLHLAEFVKRTTEGKFGNALISLAWLFYGVPLNVIYFRQKNRELSGTPYLQS